MSTEQSNDHKCEQCEKFEIRLKKLEKINKVLTDRVERSTDMQEDAFSLFQTATSLEVKVQERTAALNDALQDLEKSNGNLKLAKSAAEEAYTELEKALEKEKELSELKTRFVAMASHEFRTPLTSISSSADLLDRFHNRWDDAKKNKHLNRIQSNVAHMTKLLEDVLIFGQVDTGKIILSIESINLYSFITEMIEDFQFGVATNHTIETTLPSHSLSIKTDKKLLRMVLTNLLSNAIKYSEPESRIQLISEIQDGQLVISVSDEGIGIPEEDLARLFTPFHRASNVDNIQGTGLGLAILKKAIETYEGEVKVKSKVGEGTTFTVLLPNHEITNNCVS